MLKRQLRKIRNQIDTLNRYNLVPEDKIEDVYNRSKDISTVYILKIDIGQKDMFITSPVYITSIDVSCLVNSEVVERYNFVSGDLPNGIELNKADYNKSWWLCEYKKNTTGLK